MNTGMNEQDKVRALAQPKERANANFGSKINPLLQSAKSAMQQVKSAANSAPQGTEFSKDVSLYFDEIDEILNILDGLMIR